MFSVMKKIIIALFATSIILLLFFVFAYYNGAFILGRVLSSKVGTKVEIEKVNFKPSELEILKTKIRNPVKFTTPYALLINEIEVISPYMNYIKEDIVIDSITLKDTYLTVEFSDTTETQSNWTHIMRELSRSPEAQIQAEKNRDSLIKVLNIRNLIVEVVIPGKRTKTHKIAKLSFTNIRTEEGELVRRITQAIFQQIFFNISNVVNVPLNITEKGVKSIFQGFEILNPFGSSSNRTDTKK